MKTLALFDFDGTLTIRDSLSGYIKYVNGPINFYVGLLALSPMLIAMMLGLIPNWRAKEILISWYLKGKEEKYLRLKGQMFTKSWLNYMMRSQAMDKLHWHIQQGHDVYVVSASCETWLQPFCKKEGVGLISTRLQYHNGKFTGKLASKNCHGEEKVNRIKAAVDVSSYGEIYAYGDTLRGDGPMLDMATQSFFRKF